jgi:hypothetical protein
MAPPVGNAITALVLIVIGALVLTGAMQAGRSSSGGGAAAELHVAMNSNPRPALTNLLA